MFLLPDLVILLFSRPPQRPQIFCSSQIIPTYPEKRPNTFASSRSRRKMSTTDSQSDPSKLEGGVTNGDTVAHQQTNQSAQIDYGHYGPLARVNTAGTLYPPFAGEFQPGAFRPGPVEQRKLANPAPLGLSAFALTTFVLGCITMKARGITEPYMFVGPAYAYGGFVQILSGMWCVQIMNCQMVGE
jgi:hypothetical protein